MLFKNYKHDVCFYSDPFSKRYIAAAAEMTSWLCLGGMQPMLQIRNQVSLFCLQRARLTLEDSLPFLICKQGPRLPIFPWRAGGSFSASKHLQRQQSRAQPLSAPSRPGLQLESGDASGNHDAHGVWASLCAAHGHMCQLS